MVFNVSTHDPATLITVGALLLLVSLAAAAWPALRAARLSPTAVLRSD